MELENIVANTVYLKAREGENRKNRVKCQFLELCVMLQPRRGKLKLRPVLA